MMKTETVLQRMETGFMNWFFCRNWLLKWVLTFVGIPVLMLAFMAVCVTAAYPIYWLLGLM